MTKSVAALIVLGSLFVSPQATRFGRTIAGITAGEDDLNRVRALYGRGAETEVDQVRTLCYFVEEDHAYLSVSTFRAQNRVSSITLTTIPAVIPGCANARISGKHLSGPAGIRLGTPLTAVLADLGKPSATGMLPAGPHGLTYADYAVPGGRATCQFETQKLVLISLEVAP